MIVSDGLLIAAAGLLGTLVGVLIKELFSRRNNRDASQLQVVVEVPQKIIDQYQEMNGQLQTQVESLNSRVDNLQTRVSSVEMKNDGWRQFYWAVVVPHINQNVGPPAPVPPSSLQ